MFPEPARGHTATDEQQSRQKQHLFEVRYLLEAHTRLSTQLGIEGRQLPQEDPLVRTVAGLPKALQED